MTGVLASPSAILSKPRLKGSMLPVRVMRPSAKMQTTCPASISLRAVISDSSISRRDPAATGIALTRELIAAERKFIHVLLRDGKITDEIRRRIERDLDLEEASLANREYRRTPL